MDSQSENWYIWNMFNLWNTLYLFLDIQLASPVFSDVNKNELFLFCLKDMEEMVQYFCCVGVYSFIIFLKIFLALI